MERAGLNRNQIKYLVIAAMLVDHIAWAFVPLESLSGQMMHTIGRLTGPVMAYFVVEGYLHTRNVKHYACRLGIFALLSWIPFTYFEYGCLPVHRLLNGDYAFTFAPGVIYTLFLSLLAIWIWDKPNYPVSTRKCMIAGICILSMWGDWGIFDILFALCFYIWRKDEKRMWADYFLLCISCGILGGFDLWGGCYQLGMLLVPLLLHYFYNGKGGSSHPFHKWFFYIFYPLHLLILGILRW